MRCPRLVLSLSLLLLLGISQALRPPRPPSPLVISRKPSPSLYGYRDSIKGIDVDEVVIGSLRQVPSPVLVAVTAISSTLIVFEVSKLLEVEASLTVLGLFMVAFGTWIGSLFLILLTITMFSMLLVTKYAEIHLSWVVTAGISYMVVYFTVLTLLSLNTTPAAPQRPPKIIDVSPMTKEDDPSLEEQRRLRDFDRRLKDRF